MAAKSRLFYLIVFIALFITGCLDMPTPTAQATATDGTLSVETPVVVEPSATMSTPTAQACKVDTGISNGALNVRSGAGVKYTVLAVLNEGEIVTRTGERDGRWWQVVTRDQLTGWVNSDYCKWEGGD